jgi:putative heme-binding domain-containing protein
MRFPKEATEAMRKQLVAAAANAKLPADVRIRAMASAPGGVGQIDQATFDFVVAQLSADHPLDQRMAAAEILGAAKLSAEQQRAVIGQIKTAGAMELDRMLAAFDKTADNAIGDELVAALKESRSLKTIRPDAMRKHVAKFGPKVKEQVEAILANVGPDTAKQKARLDELMTTISGGDAHRGQTVFNQAKTSCVACHSIGYVGGHIGPDLTHVGSVRTERDLLESIVFPSASFVQTFEPMTVITDGGERHDGILKRNDADEVWLLEGPDKELHLPRKNVKELRPGTISVMPEGFDGILNKQELADLVAFLKANK